MAAAASLRSMVIRTSSEPARASAATWAAVPSTSAVSVLVIDWTAIGAPPPARTAALPEPMRTPTERRRGAGPAASGPARPGAAESSELIVMRGVYPWLRRRPSDISQKTIAIMTRTAAESGGQTHFCRPSPTRQCARIEDIFAPIHSRALSPKGRAGQFDKTQKAHVHLLLRVLASSSCFEFLLRVLVSMSLSSL